MALSVGCLLAVQTSANLQLTAAVKTPYGASTLQLALATLLLAILAFALGMFGAVTRVHEVPWWHLLGGLASPLYITSGIVLFPRLGALAAVGLFVTGQMFASLGLDWFGLLGVAQKPLTASTALGVVAVLAGIRAILQRKPAAAAVMDSRAGQIAWIALGIFAGAGLPVQGAINSQLRAELEAPFIVAMISFIVATIAIAAVLLLMLALRRTPAPQLKSLANMPWWGWLGGACAATYVTATFLLIPKIGAATTIALTVTGQQLCSAVIDHFGLFWMPRRLLTRRRITGLALLLSGAILIQLS
jgi:transporter family-2 protein